MLQGRTLRVVMMRLIRLILYIRAAMDLNASYSSSSKNITYNSSVPSPPSFSPEGYFMRLQQMRTPQLPVPAFSGCGITRRTCGLYSIQAYLMRSILTIRLQEVILAKISFFPYFILAPCVRCVIYILILQHLYGITALLTTLLPLYITHAGRKSR